MLPRQCDWCEGSDPKIFAAVRVTFADMDGVVLDSAFLCESCQKRGLTLENGKTIEPID